MSSTKQRNSELDSSPSDEQIVLHPAVGNTLKGLLAGRYGTKAWMARLHPKLAEAA
jgi:hypothetical protein